jgi:hypothetical protein
MVEKNIFKPQWVSNDFSAYPKTYYLVEDAWYSLSEDIPSRPICRIRYSPNDPGLRTRKTSDRNFGSKVGVTGTKSVGSTLPDNVSSTKKVEQPGYECLCCRPASLPNMRRSHRPDWTHLPQTELNTTNTTNVKYYKYLNTPPSPDTSLHSSMTIPFSFFIVALLSSRRYFRY